MKLEYTRVLLKISGEQLAGESGRGFDASVAAFIAKEVAEVVNLGVEVVLIVGGGNYVRGAELTGGGVGRVTADYMGMLSGVMNATAVADVLNTNSVPANALATIKVDQVADYYTQRRALHHLRKGRVVVVGGGIARPFVTHDTVAISLALELDCDVVCKITKVDGVYSKDPNKHDDAEKLHRMTLQEALENPHVKVMDKAALGLAVDNHKSIVVCELAEGNIRRLVAGEKVGTLIS
ncbi:MAG TPA: uridylate kinase [Candidatus Saccharimonadales bacterium]|nr:uridylate kinase [Candidatus Saccharimonadales bacterium]